MKVLVLSQVESTRTGSIGRAESAQARLRLIYLPLRRSALTACCTPCCCSCL